MCLLVIFSCVAMLFWFNEWRYSLPTPVPLPYRAVKIKELIDLTGKFKPGGKEPVFLHFFNPYCPCSRFNIPQFKSLAIKYADKISFAVIVMKTGKRYTAEAIRDKFAWPCPFCLILLWPVPAACWKLQIPLMVFVLIHHASLGYLQNIGTEGIYFTQLNSLELQTLIIHIILTAVIFFTCGLWAYQFAK
ncbi:MAG: AhpC/TSA family protein [Ferruginibacter sp.]|nr:AhpC/TSA family protein [Ferruginibacter sp.]